ncbi:MAG: hypothetical protein PF487_14925 [Bacteroidales bacterium]|jgi:predicted RNA-binding Zn-ribbon protein involved in translation (DUF1610 family)|nr:hypothetical protein [Bacteroidales bacterium]
MTQNFLCPKCKAFLNVGKHIILSASTQDKDAGIILLDPTIGNYTVSTNKEFAIKKGEKYEFFCPVCQEKLSSDVHDNLSKIILLDKKGTEFEVLFSKIAGEKSTYKIIGDSVDIHGDQNSNYIDFVNLSLVK